MVNGDIPPSLMVLLKGEIVFLKGKVTFLKGKVAFLKGKVEEFLPLFQSLNALSLDNSMILQPWFSVGRTVNDETSPFVQQVTHTTLNIYHTSFL